MKTQPSITLKTFDRVPADVDVSFIHPQAQAFSVYDNEDAFVCFHVVSGGYTWIFEDRKELESTIANHKRTELKRAA